MKRQRRVTRISLETERTYVFKIRNSTQVFWCARCGAEVEMSHLDEAASITGLAELTLYQSIESGALHYAEDESRRVLICRNSLLKQVEHERRLL